MNATATLLPANQPTVHAVLRDRRNWLGERQGLQVAAGGELTLARVPAPPDGRAIDMDIAYPCRREISGLASCPGTGVFVADTAHDRILFVDERCGDHAWLPNASTGAGQTGAVPGHLAAPCGLAVGADGLLVADSAHRALQQLAFPSLEPNLAISLAATPVSIAIDSLGRTLVVDRAAPRLVRLNPARRIDTAFTTRLQQQAMLQSPLCVAVGNDDGIWVSDDIANAVFVFDDAGRFKLRLTGPDGWMPGAIAVLGTTAYVADAASGAICAYCDNALQGYVNGWRGSVTALAIGAQGDLYIKPGLDATYHHFAAATAFVDGGQLRAGPFDAGEDQVWERAWFDADVPGGSGMELLVAVRADSQTPAANEWHRLPGSDALLSTLTSGSGRFVWMRVQLQSATPSVSPMLRQVRCATAAEDYLGFLPLTYRRHDQNDFLARWLKLLRAEFNAIEEAIDDLPRVADPDFIHTQAQHWLAQWFGLELPQIADEDERRALIARAVPLLARRGTPASIGQFVALHTGIRPVIVEAYTGRRNWILGVASRLDFDTRLAPFEPTGLHVPDPVGQPCPPGAIGSAVVGASGPLQDYQTGLPLFAEEAHRFCVLVDAHRVRSAGLLEELRRIVDREKPAHTDYRVEVVAPGIRIGLQARIGIDAIIGEPHPAGLDATHLGFDSLLLRADAARVGDTRLDGSLTLT